MTDLRARLVDAVREHRAVIKHGRYWTASCAGCSWIGTEPFGFRASAQDAHEGHMADVLLSLPGIAIVEVGVAVIAVAAANAAEDDHDG